MKVFPWIVSLFFISSGLILSPSLYSQSVPVADTIPTYISKKDPSFNRKKLFITTGIATYTTISAGLYLAWYKQFDQSSFHLFNDLGEWQNMDKAGHIYSAYMQTYLIDSGANWAGYSHSQSLLIGSLSSLLGQTTIEVMDGFSSGWGFSLSDMVGNVLGTSLYVLQDYYWNDQKFRLKMSYSPINYSQLPITSATGTAQSSLHNRADELYGSRLERFIKDYNGQTIWISANLSALTGIEAIPDWMALSLGYSGNNMFGGYENSWSEGSEIYNVDNSLYPRSPQFILALDYDLTSIETNNKVFKSLSRILNIFKFPAPGVSYTHGEGIQFHLLFLN